MPELNVALQRRDSKKPRLCMAAEDVEARRQQSHRHSRGGMCSIRANHT